MLCIILKRPILSFQSCDINVTWSIICNGPFHVYRSSIFLQKVEIFAPVEAFRYMFVWELSFADLFVWWNNHRIETNHMLTFRSSNIVVYATVWSSVPVFNSKMQHQNWLKLCKFINLCICLKNSLLGLTHEKDL